MRDGAWHMRARSRLPQEATLGLLRALHAFYPESGPLEPTLRMLSTDGASNVFGKSTSESRAELLGMHLNVAASGITDMMKRLSADLVKRVALSREVGPGWASLARDALPPSAHLQRPPPHPTPPPPQLDHYTAKVGKLQEAHNAARAGSAKDAAKEKLEANQVSAVEGPPSGCTARPPAARCRRSVHRRPR